MKYLHFIKSLTFLTSILIVLVSCEHESTITKDEAKTLLDSWNQAYYDKDTIALGQVLHEDYLYTGADGSQSTKKQVMDDLVTSDYRIFKTDFYDLDVRTYNNTAILRGWETLWILGSSGDTSAVSLRFMDVYLKQNGTTRAIATQTLPKN